MYGLKTAFFSAHQRTRGRGETIHFLRHSDLNLHLKDGTMIRNIAGKPHDSAWGFGDNLRVWTNHTHRGAHIEIACIVGGQSGKRVHSVSSCLKVEDDSISHIHSQGGKWLGLPSQRESINNGGGEKVKCCVNKQ
jgi:hypothetical protein